MFSYFNLQPFGNDVRRMRQINKLTQHQVSKLSGINVDTLRRIENGMVIPKYETLEILSYYYKTDLLAILQSHRSNPIVLEYYKNLDKLLLWCNEDDIIDFKKNFISICKIESNFIIENEIKQFFFLLDALILYHKNTKEDICNSIKILLQIMYITIPKFSLKTKKENKFTVIESRALLLMALNMIKQEKISESTLLLLDLLQQESITYSTDEHYKIIIKIIFNISYNFHRMDSHWNALLYANKGINLCNEYHSNYSLAHLLARKGIAEYHLKCPQYTKSLTECLILLEVTNHSFSAENYKKIFEKNYGILL